MDFYRDHQSKNLTSSISVLAITISLVVGQSATHKSVAQNATSPAVAPAISVNGAGASTVNTLFVGTGTAYPFSPKGSWFNVFGVGNPPSLNNNVPPALAGFPNGSYGPLNTVSTFRYAPVGSGAGLTAFFTQTPPPVPTGTPALNNLTILRPVSFAASDDPVAGTERVSGGPNNAGGTTADAAKYVQVPVVGVGITLAFNRTGLTVPAAGLRLSRPTYCAILNGTLTNWNDIRIRNDNGGAIIAANLPLRFVRRSDNSGSTFVLSTHLNTACKTTGTPGLPAAAVWSRGVGSISVAGTVPPTPPANTVVWPTTFLSASGGGGVATAITSNSGAIGYVDSATRLARSLPAAVLRNRAGNYTAVASTSISAAFVGATDVDSSPRRIRLQVIDPTGTTAYPIVSAPYLLFYDKYANVSIANAIKAHINWALGVPPVPASGTDVTINPNSIATARGYAPLPDAIKTLSRNVVNTYVDGVFQP
ncbi:substrate-binding domain-containing protein [Nostoc edaphicum CCNP1411]|uniref:Substrate-binding domain-containing protein n=1 Tax=Nostoc edaphicum CCNP1411 TaxID=1472755 RepID=A0A7D7QHX1_9NOSO|nr:substrate-binding domain-containing protein [Nostoc edaphicum]QMS87041.1 substrate-binding domain-containing protein [Nostoc edaphicum CCNP1411]